MDGNTHGSPNGDAQTVTLVVTMPIKPEWESEFIASAQRFVALVHEREPDVLTYILTRHPTRESTYVWIERYRSEAALADHSQTPHMAEIRPKLGTYVAGPIEALRLTQVVPV
jgi:quinol monooxygenase YgiN